MKLQCILKPAMIDPKLALIKISQAPVCLLYINLKGKHTVCALNLRHRGPNMFMKTIRAINRVGCLVLHSQAPKFRGCKNLLGRRCGGKRMQQVSRCLTWAPKLLVMALNHSKVFVISS